MKKGPRGAKRQTEKQQHFIYLIRKAITNKNFCIFSTLKWDFFPPKEKNERKEFRSLVCSIRLITGWNDPSSLFCLILSKFRLFGCFPLSLDKQLLLIRSRYTLIRIQVGFPLFMLTQILFNPSNLTHSVLQLRKFSNFFFSTVTKLSTTINY